jgi:hypothetical protein
VRHVPLQTRSARTACVFQGHMTHIVIAEALRDLQDRIFSKQVHSMGCQEAVTLQPMANKVSILVCHGQPMLFLGPIRAAQGLTESFVSCQTAGRAGLLAQHYWSSGRKPSALPYNRHRPACCMLPTSLQLSP